MQLFCLCGQKNYAEILKFEHVHLTFKYRVLWKSFNCNSNYLRHKIYKKICKLYLPVHKIEIWFIFVFCNITFAVLSFGLVLTDVINKLFGNNLWKPSAKVYDYFVRTLRENSKRNSFSEIIYIWQFSINTVCLA